MRYCEIFTTTLTAKTTSIIQETSICSGVMILSKELLQSIAPMMQMMNEMGGSPEEALQGFLSEEQMAMFKMFGEDLS